MQEFQDVFAWYKGDLGTCNLGEHSIDTQGFPPYRMTPCRLSFWEETKVNWQIQAFVQLGKMRKNMLEYACRVTLLVKKDGNQRFCGNYCPLNSQTKRDSFPMPLIKDVLMQLGKSSWFFTFDL